jgi:hypothetical protein
MADWARWTWTTRFMRAMGVRWRSNAICYLGRHPPQMEPLVRGHKVGESRTGNVAAPGSIGTAWSRKCLQRGGTPGLRNAARSTSFASVRNRSPAIARRMGLFREASAGTVSGRTEDSSAPSGFRIVPRGLEE